MPVFDKNENKDSCENLKQIAAPQVDSEKS